MSVVGEFDSILQELSTLKAPGVSGSRIKKLTDIAVKNVSEESQLISSLYSNCKATPSTHKLGSLYVVDSIVRLYKDEAKKRGETIDASAPEGTFAAGVFKISELVESIVDDSLELLIVPATNQKISKLVDIWERAQTFDPQIIANIRDKHFRSTTPPGSPPSNGAPPPAPASDPAPSANPAAVPPPPASAPATSSSNDNAASNDSGSILSALASLAKKNDTPTPPNVASPAPQAPPAPAPANDAASNILSQLSALANTSNAPQNASSPTPPMSQSQYQQPQQQAQPNKDHIFNMLQQMQGGGRPPQNAGNTPPSVPPVPQRQGMPAIPQVPNMPPMPPQGLGRGGYERRGRDDGAGYLRRNRSRSPNGRHGFSPQNQEKSLSHGFSPSDGEANIPGAPHFRPRNVGFDNTLPQGTFKVLSRTLFIGGVPFGMDERALASHLRPFAEVQSVILNSERKHAFVKVYSRREAEEVIQSFNKDGALPLRTRWGVGFGPRDCCNYQHGISIVPIQRLTDADRTWVVQAQWGGTGGQPLVSGMVVDEPDIEIGTGISSKAMSKKMPTNSTRNGPKSNRPGEPDEQYVKTSLAGGNARPDFLGYANGVPNPLSGLFGNSQQSPVQGQMPMPPQGMQGMQGMPPQGMPPQGMPPQGMPPQGMPPQGFPPNMGGANNNLSAQLASFFQNGAPQQ